MNDLGKQQIINLFNNNVRGKIPNTAASNNKHSGKEGHWLEQQMGIKHNSHNEPDLFGYEMKNYTRGKTTFGDWSADYYIFNDPKYELPRDNFLSIFGKSNVKKSGRYSWSGEPCPKVGTYNMYGQILLVDGDNNIYAYYSYSKDKRKDKESIVPASMRLNNLILAKWHAISIKAKLERKFNNNGWFKCLKDKNGVYSEIVFGSPISFDTWIEQVKIGNVFLDSGMYQGNARPYSQWRASNDVWDSLIVERY